MAILTYIIMTMAAVSALFWWLELRVFLNALKESRKQERKCQMKWGTNPFKWHLVIDERIAMIQESIHPYKKLWGLVLDVICTLAMGAVFGFGGMVGSAAGLTASNVFSVMIYIHLKQQEKEEKCTEFSVS